MVAHEARVIDSIAGFDCLDFGCVGIGCRIDEAARRRGGGDADGRIVGLFKVSWGELVMGKVCFA